MAERLREEVARKARILSPGSESRPKSMRLDRAAALWIDPLGLAGYLDSSSSAEFLQQNQHCHVDDPLIGTGVWENVSPIFGSDCRTFVSSRDNGIL
jgi:hypothetical protein